MFSLFNLYSSNNFVNSCAEYMVMSTWLWIWIAEKSDIFKFQSLKQEKLKQVLPIYLNKFWLSTC